VKKKIALVFSRTPWSEPPRIRHQITLMLLDIGYEVIYVESLFHKRKSKNITTDSSHRILVVRELFHHQLKIFSFLSFFNKHFLKIQLSSLRNISVELVVNFNYDFFFLNNLFPKSKIITILNDDFTSMAKSWMKKESDRLLRKTCSNSNIVLSVSVPIHNKSLSISNNAYLFLPWADSNYKKPPIQKKRNVILYYGYISRLDLNLVKFICNSGIKLRFVGPIEGNGHIIKKEFSKLNNVEFITKSEKIENINLDDVCCSIAFYDKRNPSILAITASNRMFRLLSFGIPLIYPDLPYLINTSENVLRKCKTEKDFVNAYLYFSNNFDSIQPEIELFLKNHTYLNRKNEFKNLINGLNSTKYV
jgi:hypothetical protein